MTRRLLGEVFDSRELRSLFPGHLSLEDARARTMGLLEALQWAPGPRRDERVRVARSRLPDPPEGEGEGVGNQGVVRFDLCLPGNLPEDSPRELWLDHAIVHETSASYQERVLATLRAGGEPSSSFPSRRRI